MKSINPKNEELIKQYQQFSDEKINKVIESSEEAFKQWKKTSFAERSKKIINLIQVLDDKKVSLAKLMACEMGKPMAEGIGEIEKCMLLCQYYIENAEQFLSPEKIETNYNYSVVHFRPLGVILSVMPWNFPFWQVFRFAIPALMAGNTAILKHASNVCGCSLEIESLFKAADFPTGIFSSIIAHQKQIKAIIENPAIQAVTLTGSTQAGKSVAQIAGANLKKAVLELGGSDPYIILKDADLKKAAQLCAKSRLLNGGQSCIAAKRFIVEESIYQEFSSELKKEMEKFTIGDPLEEDTLIGPMARIDLRNELDQLVQQTIDLGAKCILGGKVQEKKGAFYPPTILTDIKKDMPAYSQELFGPVAVIIKVKDREEAIQVANDTSFGLGGAIFSGDLDIAEKMAIEDIEVGACFINDFVKSDPRLPFGGIKQSGYGRELSHYGIREFVNIKTVCRA